MAFASLPILALSSIFPGTYRFVGFPLVLGLAIFGAWSARGRQFRWALFLPLAILLFLPGLYAPYARLWLPTETLLILLAAGSISEKISINPATSATLDARIFSWLSKTLLVITGIALTYQSIQYASKHHLLRPRAGYRDVANSSVEGLDPAIPVQTLCRWPMNYYLATQGRAPQPLAGNSFDPSGILLYDQTAWIPPRLPPASNSSWRIPPRNPGRLT